MLGRGRLPVVDDRFLVLGGGFVIAQADLVIPAELLILAELLLVVGVLALCEFLIRSQ